ncbi:LacI family DNA-binding transcriptional regulator [Lysinibacter sp. HNR]|uniref:LacI family DNA-binding transcriptional regulator n=1 Tax=Lysinibacter sp. HNR TaxID=3031408 RepID=UPI002434FE8D|nr:LacI family DNA-binding transcriptional regulator [Lysinibacter sp. HNR]WGD38272.1 LacI family DNA-binding transcriptional regulator [Lysinibacter sp. HNR]
MTKRITVVQVAEAANVSPATASRALAGNSSVDPALAKRVLEARDQLGYRANFLARALRTSRTDTVGVIVPSVSNPYFLSVIESLELAFDEVGRSIILCDSQGSIENETRRIHTLRQHMVDGLVIIPMRNRPHSDALENIARTMPVVLFDRFVPIGGVDFVGSDDDYGVRESVNHLLQSGCTSFAYIGSQPDSSTAEARLVAFRAAMLESGEGVRFCEFLGGFSADFGREAAQRLVRDGYVPDAILCAADVIAIAVLDVLRGSHIAVPDDVKLVGYDGLWLSSIFSPRLSTVEHPLDQMAHATVGLLRSRQENPLLENRTRIFQPRLIIRESSRGSE